MIQSLSEPLRIWCLVRQQESYVLPLERHFGDRATFTYDADCDAASLVSARPHLVLCVNDWPSEIVECLDSARRARIPSIVLQDGILEWRCQYENPLFGAGGGAPQHQPVLADRIACIGAQSARSIAGWGNAGRVHVTGMPRLDYLLDRPTTAPRRPGRRLLIMSAKTPGFTPGQTEVTLRSLRAVKAFTEIRPELEVTWRIGRSLAEVLEVDNRFTEVGGVELAEMIEASDAVVTTPSTAMLEGMLLHRPVAALDFHNVPRFVPTAWTISAPDQVESVIEELLEPPSNKLLFQQECLRDALRIDGPATPRVAQLIESLARNEEPGHDLCGDPGALALARLPLADLYPGQPVFSETSVEALQVRVARLQRDNRALRAAEGNRRIPQRLRRLGKKLYDRLTE